MSISLSAARARQERRTWYPPRLRRIVRAFACFVVAIIILWALITGAAGTGEKITYALAGAFVFFGGASAIIVFRLRKRRPAVVMDSQGITVRAGRGRPQFVAWDSITDFYFVRAPGMKMLAIAHRTGHAHWTDRAAFWRGGEMPPGMTMGKVAIPSGAVATSLKKLEAEIRRRVM
jgi:hypothetical protein